MLDVAAHAQIRAIELQHDAGLGDGLVLVPHRVRNGEDVRLLGRVVLVLEEERDDPRRRRRHEHLLRFHLGERRLEVAHVGLGSPRVANADRRVASGRLAPRAPRVAEHPLGEVRKRRQVLVDERVAGAAETGKSILDVRRVARLAHFAVVDDIDTGLGLLAHDLFDRRGRRARASAAGSTGTPSSFAYIARMRSSGRGRLPVCVVRNRSVLRFIALPPNQDGRRAAVRPASDSARRASSGDATGFQRSSRSSDAAMSLHASTISQPAR